MKTVLSSFFVQLIASGTGSQVSQNEEIEFYISTSSQKCTH